MTSSFHPYQFGLFFPGTPVTKSYPAGKSYNDSLGYTLYRDVTAFLLHIDNLAIYEYSPSYMARNLHCCMSGIAYTWYHSLEKSEQHRMSQDLEYFESRIYTCFAPPSHSQALEALYAEQYTVKDAISQCSALDYIETMFFYGQACSPPKSTATILKLAWNHLDKKLQNDLIYSNNPDPDEFAQNLDALAKYMASRQQQREEAKQSRTSLPATPPVSPVSKTPTPPLPQPAEASVISVQDENPTPPAPQPAQAKARPTREVTLPPAPLPAKAKTVAPPSPLPQYRSISPPPPAYAKKPCLTFKDLYMRYAPLSKITKSAPPPKILPTLTVQDLHERFHQKQYDEHDHNWKDKHEQVNKAVTMRMRNTTKSKEKIKKPTPDVTVIKAWLSSNWRQDQCGNHTYKHGNESKATIKSCLKPVKKVNFA